MDATVTPITPPPKHYTAGLRELADWLDAHPEFTPTYGGVTIHHFVRQHDGETAEETIQRFRNRSAVLEGAVATTQGSYFNVTQKFGPHSLEVTMKRDVVQPDPPHPLGA